MIKCLPGHGQTSNSLISPFPKQVSHHQGDPAGCTNLRDELASRSSPQHSSIHLRRKHVSKLENHVVKDHFLMHRVLFTLEENHVTVLCVEKSLIITLTSDDTG